MRLAAFELHHLPEFSTSDLWGGIGGIDRGGLGLVEDDHGGSCGCRYLEWVELDRYNRFRRSVESTMCFVRKDRSQSRTHGRDLGLVYHVLGKRGKQAIGLPSRAKLGATSGAAFGL